MFGIFVIIFVRRYASQASPFGQDGRPAFPGYLSAWSKLSLGFVTPIEITENGTYEARPSENDPDIYRITPSQCSEGEYFLIENRQPIQGDFDERFWSPGGITIYHIDENNLNVDGFGNSPRGGPFQSGWPENGNHYPVALLAPDGLYELEQAINNGHIEDVYNVNSNPTLGPGPGNFPNTDCYAFGDIRRTGIIISNFRVVAGSDPPTLRFDVGGLQAGPDTPSPVTPAPVPDPTPSPVTAEPVPDSTPSPDTPDTSEPTPAIDTIIPTTMNPTIEGGLMTEPPTLMLLINTTSPTLMPTVSPSLSPTIPRPTLGFRVTRPTTMQNYHSKPNLPPITRPTIFKRPTVHEGPEEHLPVPRTSKPTPQPVMWKGQGGSKKISFDGATKLKKKKVDGKGSKRFSKKNFIGSWAKGISSSSSSTGESSLDEGEEEDDEDQILWKGNTDTKQGYMDQDRSSDKSTSFDQGKGKKHYKRSKRSKLSSKSATRKRGEKLFGN